MKPQQEYNKIFYIGNISSFTKRSSDNYRGKEKGKTFKVQKNIKEGSKRFELHKQLQATLGSGDLRYLVTFPSLTIQKRR